MLPGWVLASLTMTAAIASAQAREDTVLGAHGITTFDSALGEVSNKQDCPSPSQPSQQQDFLNSPPVPSPYSDIYAS